MIEIKIRQVQDGWIYDINGVNKGGGEGVRKNTEEFDLLEKIGKVILGFDVKVIRK